MKKEKKLNGYMTLEAAMIVPIVWFTLFFAIFTGFYLYDRCIAEQDCKIILMQASNMEKNNDAEIVRKINEKVNLADKKKLLFSNSVSKDIQVTDKKAEIEIRGNIPTILNSLMKDNGLSPFTYAAAYETDRYEPVRFIRNCRRVKGYVKN